MPRTEDRDQAPRRPGPYEAEYQVLRGYDAPPAAHARKAEREPVFVARRRDPAEHR